MSLVNLRGASSKCITTLFGIGDGKGREQEIRCQKGIITNLVYFGAVAAPKLIIKDPLNHSKKAFDHQFIKPDAYIGNGTKNLLSLGNNFCGDSKRLYEADNCGGLYKTEEFKKLFNRKCLN
jgi:hypothetical protein